MLVAGESLLHYRILEPLGGGGMGVVWKALDTRLQREVALKLLRADALADAGTRERFLREARCASALNHPNIVTIYDVNAEGERHFIVMESVGGRSLRDILSAGRVELPAAMSYIGQMCSALAEAHAAGIVHRDLKPGNIMITPDGRVKLLDFGLAKVLERPSAESETLDLQLTEAGSALGTIGYMAPEQAMGGVVDARSDVFSLGVLMYEVLGGTRPFPGTTWQAYTGELLNREPRPLRDLAPQVPPRVAAVVHRCLARNPAERFADCAEVRDALEASPAGTRVTLPGRAVTAALVATLLLVLAGLWWWSSGSRTERGVAVLPFTVVNTDERTQALAAGLVQTVSAALTAPGSLGGKFWVVPPGDVLVARAHSAKEAREQFGVDVVITGSVETTGERMRITAAVSDARTSRQLRSRQFTTAAAADSFALQDELAQAVAELLEVQLPGATRDTLRTGASGEPGVQDFYLQARGYLQASSDKADAVIQVLTEALRRDPRYARAHAGLAEAYLLKYNVAREPEWIAKARSECEQALRLEPSLVEARLTQAMIEKTQGQYEQAVSTLREITAGDPQNRDAWIALGQASEARQDKAAAEAAYRRAVELQPGYPGGHQNLFLFYYRNGRYADAERSVRRALELAPDSYRVYNQLGALYMQRAQYPQAERAFRTSVALKPNANAYNNLASCYTYQRRFSEAVPMMEQAVALGQKNVTLLGNLLHMYKMVPGQEGKVADAARQALDVAHKQLAVNPRDAEARADLAWVLAASGQRASAAREIADAQRQGPANATVLFRSVLVHELLGQREQALRDYASLIKTGSFLEEVERRPELDSLRNDPRFKEESWQRK